MATGGRYPNEVSAIETTRLRYPEVGPYTLARQIKNREIACGNVAACRTLYSILSVIRRFDAKQKKTAKAA